MGGSIKKFLLPAFAILYDVSTLVWCYVIASGLAYAVTFVSQTEMGIIGGADIPRFLFQVGNLLKLILSLLFVVLSIGTAVLLTLSACKKHISRKAAIVLCVPSAVSFIVFFFIPVDTYLVSLYTIVRNLSLVTCAHIVHIVLSGAVVLVNILSLKSTRANYEKPVKL